MEPDIVIELYRHMLSVQDGNQLGNTDLISYEFSWVLWCECSRCIRFKINYMTPFEVHVVILNCCLVALTSFGSHIQSSNHVPCQSAYKVTYQHRILTGFLSQFVWFLILICGLILFVSLERELAQVLRQQNSSSMSYKFLLRSSPKHQRDISLLVIYAQCYKGVICIPMSM